MLHITPIAKDELREMLGRVAPAGSEQEELGFRIVPTPGEEGSLSLALDHPRSQDEIHSHEQRNVLLLDSRSAERLDGFTLDLAETPEGKRLTIR
jgi:Fe-S cluster assembly iron-binding protein IscA